MKYKIDNQPIRHASVYMVIFDNNIIFRIEPDDGFDIAEKGKENPERVRTVNIPESRKDEINNYIAIKKEGRQYVHDFERNSV